MYWTVREELPIDDARGGSLERRGRTRWAGESRPGFGGGQRSLNSAVRRSCPDHPAGVDRRRWPSTERQATTGPGSRGSGVTWCEANWRWCPVGAPPSASVLVLGRRASDRERRFVVSTIDPARRPLSNRTSDRLNGLTGYRPRTVGRFLAVARSRYRAASWLCVRISLFQSAKLPHHG